MGSKSYPPDADPVRPWASGRVLTTEQRERKRLVDRNARRSQKQRFLDRIGQLEERIVQLEHEKTQPAASEQCVPAKVENEGSPEPAPIDTTFHHVQQNQQNQQHQHQHQHQHQQEQQQQQQQQQPWSGYLVASPSGATQPLAQQQYQQNPAQAGAWYYDAQGGQVQQQQTSFLQSAQSLIPSASQITSELSSLAYVPNTLPVEGREITDMLNGLVHYVRQLPSEAVSFDDSCNKDFLVRYVLHGWESVTDRYAQICPLWVVMHMVDLWLFRSCPVLERIVMLRTVHYVYLFEISSRSNPLKTIPQFYKSQPRQTLSQHDPVIDHLAWPRLRAHLTRSESGLLTNRFWAMFGRSFRFAWSHGLLGMVHVNSPDGRYGLSGTFETALFDIRNWRMVPEFTACFPSLTGDVVPSEYMPLVRQPTPNHGQQEKIIPRFGQTRNAANLNAAAKQQSFPVQQRPSSVQQIPHQQEEFVVESNQQQAFVAQQAQQQAFLVQQTQQPFALHQQQAYAQQQQQQDPGKMHLVNSQWNLPMHSLQMAQPSVVAPAMTEAEPMVISSHQQPP